MAYPATEELAFLSGVLACCCSEKGILLMLLFFFPFVCAVKDIYYRWQQPTPPKKRYAYTYLLSLVALHLFDLNHFMAIASTDMPHWQMCFNLGKYENGSFWFVVTYILLYIIWYMNLAKRELVKSVNLCVSPHINGIVKVWGCSCHPPPPTHSCTMLCAYLWGVMMSSLH